MMTFLKFSSYCRSTQSYLSPSSLGYIRRFCSNFRSDQTHLFTPQLAISRSQDAIVFYHPDSTIEFQDTIPMPKQRKKSPSVKSELVENWSNDTAPRKKTPSVHAVARKFHMVPRNVWRERYRQSTKRLDLINETERRPYQ